MAPALIVLAIGVNPTDALVLSQVVLSFGIPFALVPLILLTRRRDVMGALVNQRRTTVAGLDRRRPDHLAQPLPDRPDHPRADDGYPPGDGTRRHVPGGPRLAARRLDGHRARPADLRRAPLRRGRDVPRHLQRPAVLRARLALADPLRPPLRATPPRRPRCTARSCSSTRRASPGSSPCARCAPAARPCSTSGGARSRCARSSAGCTTSSAMARVIALVPDLLFGSKVQAALAAAGHEVELTGDESRRAPDAPAAADVLVVDLATDAIDGAGARRGDARGRRARRRRARSASTATWTSRRASGRCAAGFDQVVPRSRMNREGADARHGARRGEAPGLSRTPERGDRGREQPRDVGPLARRSRSAAPRSPRPAACAAPGRRTRRPAS